MASLTIQQVYQLARDAGLSHAAAITATAIAMGESGLNPSAVGDTTLTDATWGPSYGLWQIRSVKSESGTNGTRDARAVARPSVNAASMAAISGGGTNWGPWSVYTNGTYKKYVDQVREAVGSGSAPQVGSPPVPHGTPVDIFAPSGKKVNGGAQETGIDIPSPGELLEGAEEALGGVGGKVGDLAGSVVSLLVKEIAPALLIGVGVLGGFVIIGVGAWRAMESAETGS